MLYFNTAGQRRYVLVSGAVNSVSVRDYLGADHALVGTFDDATEPGVCKLAIAAADVNYSGGAQSFVLLDAGGNCVGVLNEDVVNGPPPTQAEVAAVGALVTPAAIRAAVGLALANLDTQLAAIGTMTPAAIRAAIGMTAANLDAQLATLVATQPGPVNLTNTALQSIITAVGQGVPIVPVPPSPSSFPYHNDAL